MMQLPLKYIVRSSVSRRLTTAITILGIALVVFVFTAVLMMANGVQKTLRSTGSDDNLLVARKAAMSEIMSIMDREAAGIIVNLPQVAQSADGTPISSKEVVVIINLHKLGAEGISNVTVRGVEAPAFQLRPQVKIAEGRMFNWGAREVIAGAGITKRFVGAQLGGKIKFACVDGPEFDGHLVDFDELQKRLRTYNAQEKTAVQKFQHSPSCIDLAMAAQKQTK